MLQNATTPLRKSPPSSPNTSTSCVSCTAPATENASLQILFKCPRLPSFLEMLQNPHVLLTFDKAHNPLHLPRTRTSERPTAPPSPSVFCTFDFEMCFAQKRRALFRHVNFQKLSFSTSQLPKVLWTGSFLTLLTSKCASRHNGVHFFDISTSKHGPTLV